MGRRYGGIRSEFLRVGCTICFNRCGAVFHFRVEADDPDRPARSDVRSQSSARRIGSVKSYEDILATLMMGTKIAVFLLMLSLYLIAVERIACVHV